MAGDEAEHQVWQFKRPMDSWTGGPLKPGLRWPVSNGAMVLTADARGKASISKHELDLPAESDNIVQLEVSTPTAMTCRLLFSTAASPRNDAEKTIEFALQDGGGRQLYNLDLKNVEAWKGNIAGLRFEFLGAKPGDEIAVSAIKVLVGDKISKPLIYTEYQAGPKVEVKTFRLGSLFGDGMVLQRNLRIPVWGRAEAGATVEV
ncbi:MAG: hypothetical protein NTW86_01445 [Candidatus Sumerlaeota bacterium]|nr:hypothetical protein [Candidatus Sumerlaeota bacterium]